SFQAVQGATYRIAIDGLNAVIGTFELLVSLAPANDDFANAEAISGESGSVAGTTVGASRQPGEPDYLEASVWYRWTAPSNGWATFELCGSGFQSPPPPFPMGRGTGPPPSPSRSPCGGATRRTTAIASTGRRHVRTRRPTATWGVGSTSRSPPRTRRARTTTFPSENA